MVRVFRLNPGKIASLPVPPRRINRQAGFQKAKPQTPNPKNKAAEFVFVRGLAGYEDIKFDVPTASTAHNPTSRPATWRTRLLKNTRKPSERVWACGGILFPGELSSVLFRSFTGASVRSCHVFGKRPLAPKRDAYIRQRHKRTFAPVYFSWTINRSLKIVSPARPEPTREKPCYLPSSSTIAVLAGILMVFKSESVWPEIMSLAWAKPAIRSEKRLVSSVLASFLPFRITMAVPVAL